MEDAERTKMPSAMRDLFTVILINTEIANPSELWHRFSNSMSMDYRMTMERQVINQDNLINENAIQCTLKYLEDRLTAAGKSLQDFELPLHTSESAK